MEKEKIYFIPGLMTDIRLWSRALPFLKDDFEMIYYIQLKKQGKKETTENE